MAHKTHVRRWGTIAQGAEEIGVTADTVRNYIARGDLKAYRPRGSRLIRIDLDDLDALMVEIPATDGAA